MARNDKTQVTALIDDLPAFSRQRGGGVFIVLKGPDRGESVSVQDQPVYFGSAPACEMVLTDKTVSRRHLLAVPNGASVILKDQGSTNGSFVQGSRFKEITIGYGAEFKVGRTLIKYLPEEEIVDPSPSEETSFGQLIGSSTKMRQLFNLLQDVAATDATVLIEGETGTGKELIAEEIHNHSKRRDGPFIVFDCGSVPRELIESALFGHVKGSFTGAQSDKDGLVKSAHGGTLFLDEIGELNLELQPQLLRVIEKREVRRVGETQGVKVDIRIIAATNRDLRAMVAKGSFREDLFFRLAVVPIEVPPLRERREDIPLLIDTLLVALSDGGPSLTVADDARDALVAHDWPGNVRELRNVLERAAYLARATGETDVRLASVPFAGKPAGWDASGMPAFDGRKSYRQTKSEWEEVFEKRYVQWLLERNEGNISAAAREADMDRKYLHKLAKKHGLHPSDSK